jgi:hypothetical protein
LPQINQPEFQTQGLKESETSFWQLALGEKRIQQEFHLDQR